MSVNMFSRRAVQLSTRRLAAANPSMVSKSLRLASPASVAMGQFRPAATTAPAPSPETTTITAAQGNDILAAQRRHRPVSPHLGIYKWQVTWIPSALNRITGSVLSGGFYIYGFGYLVAPYLGLHWESATFAAAVAAWPVWLKLAAKFPLAWCMTFHSFNGLRHLVWDTGAAFTNKQVIITGWTVIGVSLAAALGLTFY